MTRSRVTSILDACLSGADLEVEDAVLLCTACGDDLLALRRAADMLRQQQVGEVVTYVVNRNVNFTNVCIKACRFCAFSRRVGSAEAYTLPIDEVVRQAVEARDKGATEVCLQAGLAPGPERGRTYVELCRAVKRAAPELHLHAYSPEEVVHGASGARMPIREYLLDLKEAGLGSLPGTSAEVLDDDVRRVIAPERMSTAQWVEVIRTAHGVGLPTTATLMFGHVETDLQRMRHLDLLRSIQRETAGFTEFVPLSFVHMETPLYQKVAELRVRPGPSHEDVVRLIAIARLMLGKTFRNLQTSWVKEGVEGATDLLLAGANDLGGTLMGERISTAAGAENGQELPPSELRRMATAAGRVPAERDTLYGIRRRFGPASADPRRTTA